MADTPTVAARRARLQQWIDERHGGKQADFIAATQINQGELSALLKGKSFGEKKAGTIEAVAGMPEGYLVHPLTPLPTASSAPSQAARLDLEKLHQAIEIAMAMRGPLLAENVVAAYEHLTREVVVPLPSRGRASVRGGEHRGAFEGRDTGAGQDPGSQGHQGRKKG